MPPIVTLTSDYGARDAFAASIKGVILRINPQVQIIDISNDIAPVDIWEGAYTLWSAYKYFPKGTIHLAVIDPGVGSGRRPIIAVTEGYYFIGPDNGLFSLIYQDAERLRASADQGRHLFEDVPRHALHTQQVSGIREETARCPVRSNRLRQFPTHARQTRQHVQARRVNIDRSGQVPAVLSRQIIADFP